MAAVGYPGPLFTAPIPLLTEPVPPVKVGVRITIAPYRGLMVEADKLAVGMAYTVTVAVLVAPFAAVAVMVCAPVAAPAV
jgi:hypothetical protein